MKVFNSQFNHKLNYIHWKGEAKLELLTKENFANLLQELKNSRTLIKLSAKLKTNRELFNDTVFAFDKKGNYAYIYYYKNGYKIASTNTFDDSKIKSIETYNESRGQKAISEVNKTFKKLENTTLKAAFGTVEEEFKRCVPKQITWCNKFWCNRLLNFSSIDIASSFPAGMCGRLPDQHTAVGSPGLHRPTKEYPFAFYINSGHIAECGDNGELVYDTHEWLKKEYAINLFRLTKDNKPTKMEKFPQILNVKPEDEYTILMKASKYELTNTYKYWYNIKESYDQASKEYQLSKLVMNASIGNFHKRTYDRYKYAHLAAVAIARANKKMIDMIDKIGYANIAQVQVDGIIYIGDVVADYNKEFGKFAQEFEYIPGKIMRLSNYVFMKDGKIIKWKSQGNNFDTKRNIAIDENYIPESFDDMYNWKLIDNCKELIEEIINE